MVGEVASLNEGRYDFGATATDLSFTHCEGGGRKKMFDSKNLTFFVDLSTKEVL